MKITERNYSDEKLAYFCYSFAFHNHTLRTVTAYIDMTDHMIVVYYSLLNVTIKYT
jgi:hypothetical protein